MSNKAREDFIMKAMELWRSCRAKDDFERER